MMYQQVAGRRFSHVCNSNHYSGRIYVGIINVCIKSTYDINSYKSRAIANIYRRNLQKKLLY